MPKRRTVDEESELGCGVDECPEELPATKFQFTAASLYKRVNEYRSALQYKLNKNAEVIDRIPMWVGQASIEGRTEVRLVFPYRFSTDNPMHKMLVSRMTASMPSEFKHVPKPPWGRASGSTGWCIGSADADDESSFLGVWWTDPEKLVLEPSHVTWPESAIESLK